MVLVLFPTFLFPRYNDEMTAHKIVKLIFTTILFMARLVLNCTKSSSRWFFIKKTDYIVKIIQQSCGQSFHHCTVSPQPDAILWLNSHAIVVVVSIFYKNVTALQIVVTLPMKCLAPLKMETKVILAAMAVRTFTIAVFFIKLGYIKSMFGQFYGSGTLTMGELPILGKITFLGG